MAELKFRKVPTLPADALLEASTFYLVTDPTDATKVQIWLTSKAGGTLTKRRVHTAADIAAAVLTELDTEIGVRETDFVSLYNTAKA